MMHRTSCVTHDSLRKKHSLNAPKFEQEALSIHRPAWRLKLQYQVLEKASKKRNDKILYHSTLFLN